MKDKDGGKEGVIAMQGSGGGGGSQAIWKQKGKLGTHPAGLFLYTASLQRATKSFSQQPLRTITSSPFYR